ncbi:alpha,alpha-phosphotrehalase [Rossellomorea vietnamensis]|uniref:alpha,alpha-phosphotrehalase n=1 Tax=Rossellomorea vietnamensis TaxID=218284 RepID=UPI001CCB4CE4|nr:alpha,alpha-phosphotrehalase [Rossellomorea vietnamensis]MCA0150511.1 alpha,alpha-phosphotrehalase [Rossellomorea vietnamensis]
MEKAWWHKSTIYQIYPRSFKDSNGDGIGDLKGIIEKLDYLNLLGIDIIWLSPVYQSPNDDNGYDISNYYEIMPDFGTLEDMEKLIEEAKKRDIHIMMDLVINHTSDEHAWFEESRKSKDNPYRDYYIWRESGDGPPSDIQSVFSGPAWEWDEQTGEYYFHLFSKKQPDLNLHNPEVREHLYKMMNYWLDKGVSGFRMDVIDLIGKEIDEKVLTDGPRLHEYLQEMNEKVLSHYPTVTVGETPSATPETAKLYTGKGRNELDMVFTFQHMSLDERAGEGKWALKDLDFPELKRVLSEWQTSLFQKGWNSLYWNNHDQPRIVSRWGNDQEYRIVSAKMLATVLHMMQGTPFIYQGEEIGMTNINWDDISQYRDIETINYFHEKKTEGVPEQEIMKSIRTKGRDNARTPFQWNDDIHGGFTEGNPWIEVNSNFSEITAEQALKDQDSIFYHYKKLIALRKRLDILVYGEYELLLGDHPEIMAYSRKWDDQTLLVVANFYGGNPEFHLPEAADDSHTEILISNYSDSSERPSDINSLRPYEAIVYLLEK